MKTITVQIDDETFEKAQYLAKVRQCNLSQLVTEGIKKLADFKINDDPWLGMLADEPELADAILKDIEDRRSKFNL